MKNHETIGINHTCSPIMVNKRDGFEWVASH